MIFQTLFGLVDTLAHLGRQRANPDACHPNNLKTVDTCDCTDLAVCEDVFSDVVAAARSFAGFTYVLDGVTRVFSVLQPIESPDGSGTVIIPVRGLIIVTDVVEIHEWILKVLTIFEVEPALTVTYTIGTTTVTYNHTGAGAITVITYDDASTESSNSTGLLGSQVRKCLKHPSNNSSWHHDSLILALQGVNSLLPIPSEPVSFHPQLL